MVVKSYSVGKPYNVIIMNIVLRKSVFSIFLGWGCRICYFLYVSEYIDSSLYQSDVHDELGRRVTKVVTGSKKGKGVRRNAL